MNLLGDYNANNLIWDYRINTLLRDESATALSWNQYSTMLIVENVAKKYAIMDSICQPGKFSQYTAVDLSSVGLIPYKNKTIIAYNLRQMPPYQRDDYYKIATFIKEEYSVIQRRDQRLAKVLSWNMK